MVKNPTGLSKLFVLLLLFPVDTMKTISRGYGDLFFHLPVLSLLCVEAIDTITSIRCCSLILTVCFQRHIG